MIDFRMIFPIITLFLFMLPSAYADPITDVKDGTNNAAGEYFLPAGLHPSNAQEGYPVNPEAEYFHIFYRNPGQDWEWRHTPIAGEFQELTLEQFPKGST